MSAKQSPRLKIDDISIANPASGAPLAITTEPALKMEPASTSSKPKSILKIGSDPKTESALKTTPASKTEPALMPGKSAVKTKEKNQNKEKSLFFNRKEKDSESAVSAVSSLSSMTGPKSGSFEAMEMSKTVVLQSSNPLHNSPLYGQNPMHSYLVCLLGPEELVGRYWMVNEETKIIGRSRNSHIPIQDLSISKKHLKIRVDETQEVFVQDQGATNGTLINNKKMDPQAEIKLKDNDKVKMGSIVFKFLKSGNPEIFSVKSSLEKSFRDTLTGVGNRLMLERRAKELFQQSKRHKTPLSLIIFDIDHFKKVNDTYGHPAGDFILRETAQMVKTCFRSDDIVTRCGGEEFCIIVQSLPGRAESAMESARKKLQSKVFKYKDQKIKVTLSAGISCYQSTDKKWKNIYERADKLLYKAKTTGRNKIFASPG